MYFRLTNENLGEIWLVPMYFRLTNENTYQWKALRLLARRSPMFFTHTNTPALPLNQYLNTMLQKLAKELPVSWHFTRYNAVDTVQSLYNTPHYNMDSDITLMMWLHGFLQRYYRKMTMKWSFSYNTFVKLFLYDMIHLSHGPFLWTPNIRL